MKDKTMLLIFPPQWTPISPHYAVPSLLGQLKSKGYRASALDLNIDFFDYILDKEKLKQAISHSVVLFEDIKKEIIKIYSPLKSPSDYSFEEQITLFKYNKLKNFVQKINSANFIVEEIENALNTIKSEEFYNPQKIIQAINLIDKALEIISIPYTPTRISFDGVLNPFYKFNYENIKYFTQDKNSNIFINFFESRINDIIQKNPNFIGISLNSSSQIISGLTLSKMLKERTNAHINIGGNFFGRIADELKKHKEFFEFYTHSISVEEGEASIIETAKFINHEIEIEKVPNLIYLKEGEVKQNEKMPPVKLNNVCNMDLSDYNLEKYYAPKIVLPYQTSRGCYWGKCSFCDQDFGQNHSIKSSDKVIQEFIEFRDKYKINNFEFIDESLSPAYLQELSDKIKENNLDVEFFMDARLETGFSYELLQKAYSSGLRMVLWGLESGSEKIMKLINKGIDLDKRFEILENSAKSGVWNFAFIFFGFPAETKEDAKKTVDMLVQNKDIIHSYGRSVFTMGRHAKLAEEPEKYGITKIYPAEEEFSPNINFDCIGMNQQELKEILNYCIQECAKAYKNPLWMFLRYREWLFLYVSRYGVEHLKEISII
ncbi:radical SAM protein [bacterium]|nr:radical SAM protein [bacterium]